MQHKRFLLFSFNDYYPSGGIGDIKREFDTAADAIFNAKQMNEILYELGDHAYIFDCETRTIIWDKE
jgi:hypothetical protein